MSVYDSLIDPTDFGTVAKYLSSKLSEIEYILYVKDVTMLSSLAEQLDSINRLGHSASGPRPRLMQLIAEGSILISSRLPLQMEPRSIVDATTIPANAFCRVLYLPPFYLVHIPGLFEGTLVREVASNRHRPAEHVTRSKGIKL